MVLDGYKSKKTIYFSDSFTFSLVKWFIVLMISIVLKSDKTEKFKRSLLYRKNRS